MCSDVAIKVKNLSKFYQIYEKPADRLKQSLFRGRKRFYKEFKALSDVSFSVKKGETFGIIGRNGAGKSTLLQLLCGTLAPTSGEISIEGRVAALLELGSGFNPEFTGRENIFLNASVLGLTDKEIESRFEDIVSFADIGDHLDQPVKTYSSGMVVRLAFSVIAHVDADVLIIDEALSVGDAFFVQKCMRYLRNFMATGTVLFVSHDTGAVLNLCDECILIENGVKAAQGKPKDIVNYYLEKSYEAEHGKSSHAIRSGNSEKKAVKKSIRDMRLDFINQTSLRNDIEIFSFSEQSGSFGKGAARIRNVEVLDENRNRLSWVVGGERVIIRVECQANEDLFQPIVGFMVKDRLGQVVFADNTYMHYLLNPISFNSGELFEADFEFVMPVMPKGDYAIAAAIANGTQQDHVQHHWIHDALVLKVHGSSVCHGLIGVPMLGMEMRAI